MGTGQWILLDKAANSALSGFANQAEVLVNTRLAADAVGAAKIDRPESVAVHPSSGEVYVTMTNNSSRTQIDDANPRATTAMARSCAGAETGNNPSATTFEWDLFVLAAVPTVHNDLRRFEQHSRPTTCSTAPMASASTRTGGCGSETKQRLRQQRCSLRAYQLI